MSYQCLRTRLRLAAFAQDRAADPRARPGRSSGRDPSTSHRSNTLAYSFEYVNQLRTCAAFALFPGDNNNCPRRAAVIGPKVVLADLPVVPEQAAPVHESIPSIQGTVKHSRHVYL